MKSYLRYKEERSFGVVTSPYAPVLYDHSGKYAITAALDRVAIWSIKKSELITTMHYDDNETKSYDSFDKPGINITSLQLSPDGYHIAAGYQDGRVVIFKITYHDDAHFEPKNEFNHDNDNNNDNDDNNHNDNENNNDNNNHNDNYGINDKYKLQGVKVPITWKLELSSIGHSSAVSFLQFSNDGSLLASGSDDTKIVLWDVISSMSLYELRGHKGRITGLIFISEAKILISSSKDMLLKFWELETQHCIQTIIATKNEIWSIAKNPQETRLVAGSTDNELYVWNIESLIQNHDEDGSQDIPLYERDIIFIGKLKRQKDDLGRIWMLKFDNQGQVLAVHSDSNYVELYRLRSLEEQKKRTKQKLKQIKLRRKKQDKEKQEHIPDLDDDDDISEEDVKKKHNDDVDNDNDGGDGDVGDDAGADNDNDDGGDNDDNDDGGDDNSDGEKDDKNGEIHELNYAAIEYEKLIVIETSQKVRSFDFHPNEVYERNSGHGKDNIFKILVGTLRNTLEEYSISNVDANIKKCGQISKSGHGLPIRAVAFANSDSNIICSVGKKECKMWNVKSGKCLRNFYDVGYGLCCSFLPGNKHIVIGTKNGALEIYDVNSGEKQLSFLDAHKDSIWSVLVTPDKSGLISGSSDKSVKFWSFTVITDKNDGNKKKLGLKLDHIVQMTDEVMCITCSRNAKFIAVALLDSTVKVFYLDSLKFFLSLYGHKLPVNAMDISSDENLIVTASQDKNIKLWGLDFGDCHKSIFAHEESITAVQFVVGTHYFFSTSRDGSVKYWDADNYECIQILRMSTPHSPLFALSVSNDSKIPGYHVVCAGHERAIIMYQQTDEQIFMEEEKEKRMEQEYANELVKSQQFKELDAPNAESAHAGKRTIDNIREGEQLIESLDLSIAEDGIIEENKKSEKAQKIPSNPLLMGMSTDRYVWHALKSIKGSELDNVLSLITYPHAVYILKKLNTLVTQSDINIELASRIIFILLRIYRTSITSDSSLYELIKSLSEKVRNNLKMEKDIHGFNLAALHFIKRRLNNEKELLSVDEVASTIRKQNKQMEWNQKEQKKKALLDMKQQSASFSFKIRPAKRYLREDAFRESIQNYKEISSIPKWKVNQKRRLEEDQKERDAKYQKIIHHQHHNHQPNNQ